ncbi:MAG: adenylate/guanylate cyclase domain-containing protein [Reyranella sp.]|nr:adenylate/guanylate cyclase domain-containing protein [Reyranella sp.]
MTDPELVRRLTTIMDIDVVGFSSMSARDEEHALALLGNRMATAQALVKHHRGRVFKLTGDGLLAEFASPVEAVRAALEIQEAMRAANDPAAPNDQMVLRIGVNLGDVVESGEDLLGDAVNVAARLESIAKPGGVCVSAAVYEQIAGKLTLGAEDMGEQHVKNIPRAIHAYRLTIGGGSLQVSVATPAVKPQAAKTSRLAVIVGGGALVAVLAIAGVWFLYERSGPAAAPTRVAEASAAPPAAAPVPAAPAPAASVPAPAPPAAVAAVPATAPPPPAAAAPPPPAPRPYVASEVPFVPHWRERRLEEYARAEDAKAMAINVRGWFAIATRMLDVPDARRRALEECNALVEREVPISREFDPCMIYAVGNEVVWPFRPPPMPPAPYVPAAKLSPPVPLDPATVPLITERARQNLVEHYMRTTRHRAFVLGHGPTTWWSPSESDADAIRRNLQTCGQITGRPCFVYSVDDQVVVRVPQLHRVIGIFTPQAVSAANATQQSAIERYLVDNDWRAIAVADNGHLGIVSGKPGEADAARDALGECRNAAGVECKLLAIGPWLVAPK